MRLLPALGCCLALAAGEAAIPQPTPDEVQIIELINDWRLDPAMVRNTQDELIRQNPSNLLPNGKMGIATGKAEPVPPLVMNLRLMAAARAMAAAGTQPVQETRTKPDAFLTSAGYQPLDKAIALTAVGGPDLRMIQHMAMCQVVERTDTPIKDRILSKFFLSRLDLLRPELREIGVGLKQGKGGGWGIAEIAGIGQAKRLVGGVAYLDANRNGVYDLKEGVGDIVFACGDIKTTCGAAGAWSLELPHANATSITATGNNLNATFPIESGAATVYLRWRLPMPTDQKECDTLLTAADKEADAAKKRLAQLSLLIASRRWIIDQERQAKTDALVKPVVGTFENVQEALRDAMPLDPPDFKKKLEVIKKRLEGVKESAGWIKTATALHDLRQQVQAWQREKDKTPTAPLIQQIDKMLATNPDPEFAKQLRAWLLDFETAAAAATATKSAKPKK